MLTGDHSAVGESIGNEVGVDDVRGELLPEDKVTAIQSLLKEHGSVAMVGDGVNDAPALAQATVGIAMGAAGTALAVIAALILATTTGVFGIGPAVFIHEGSTLLVIGNALRPLVHEG